MRVGAVVPDDVDGPIKRLPATGLVADLRRHCFGSSTNSVASVAALVVLGWIAVIVFRWAVVDAVFVAATPERCRIAAGACWATVYHHAQVIFFALYPREQQWRAGLALFIFLAAVGLCGSGMLRSLRAYLALVAGTWVIFIVLMGGGILALGVVPEEQWGGLPLTVHIFLGTIILGFPLAVILALGREAQLSSARWFCVALIQAVRAVPLLTILFCAAVVLPLMIPGALNPAKANRIMLALALFFACYEAEVIRGGIRAVPLAEIESARALGLSPRLTMLLIVLPQAVRLTIPATVNLVVIAFKDTSMIVIVGLFDFIASANTAIASDVWAPYFREIYVMVAATFLAIAGSLSWLGRAAERRFTINR